MNKIFIFIIAMSFFFCSFSFYDLLGFNQEELPSVDIALDKVLSITLKKLQTKQPLVMIGLGGSKKDYKKETIRVSLSLNKILLKEECRKLIIECVEQYLKNINSDVDLQQYLYSPPFTVENMVVKIFLTMPDHSDIPYPNISIVSAFGGNVFYKVDDPNNKYNFIVTQEPYEEALRIVQAEK